MNASADRLESLFGVNAPVVVVTGSAAPRIGREIALLFAQEGYRLVVHANHSIAQGNELVERLTNQGCQAMLVTADLSQPTEIETMFEEVDHHFGRVDVLVNSAAIWERTPWNEVTPEDLLRHFQINTLGTFLCSQQAARRMVDQSHGGAIINLGDWGVSRPYVDYAAYWPSKGAIGAMTRSLAVELAAVNRRIRVNAVLPGPAMLPEGMPATEREAAIAATLLQRAGHPNNVAQAVRSLAENDFITGACLPVDGGRSIAS